MSQPTDTSEPADPAALTVPPEAAGERYDRWLASAVPALSRAKLRALIEAGRVTLDGAPATDPSRRLRGGEAVALDAPAEVTSALAPEVMDLAVVHEDEAVVVVDKPAGLVVHPGPGHAGGTLANGLLARYGAAGLSSLGGPERPGIVHRLDRDTTGLLVIARTDAAHRRLAAQFADHGRNGALERGYLALAWGVPAPSAGTIDRPLERSPRHRERVAIAPAGRGREAVTHYRTEATHADREGLPIAARLALRLETGRTHQVRVHLAGVGHPLLGDAAYAGGHRTRASRLGPAAAAALAALPGQALHARLLAFEHPVTRRSMRFESAPPPAMAALLAALERGG